MCQVKVAECNENCILYHTVVRLKQVFIGLSPRSEEGKEGSDDK